MESAQEATFKHNAPWGSREPIYTTQDDLVFCEEQFTALTSEDIMFTDYSMDIII